MSRAVDSRRGFLGSLLLVSVGAAATILGGCAAPEDEQRTTGSSQLPPEPVAVPEGMHHAATMPAGVPDVRTIAEDQDAFTAPLSTKS